MGKTNEAGKTEKEGESWEGPCKGRNVVMEAGRREWEEKGKSREGKESGKGKGREETRDISCLLFITFTQNITVFSDENPQLF